MWRALTRSRLDKDQILSGVALKAHVRIEPTAQPQRFKMQKQGSESGGRRGSSAEAGGSESTLQGARKHTLSAQLKKLCEIIKHDRLLLVSITSKSKLSEDDARSARTVSAPIG